MAFGNCQASRSKRGSATFFTAANDPTVGAGDNITAATHGIDRMVEWANTSRGVCQYDLINLIARSGNDLRCSSAYGFCE